MATKSMLEQLKIDMKENHLHGVYVFYGEEAYLKNYYLSAVHKQLIPESMDAFNYHYFNGKDLSFQSLADALEAVPMMAEHSLTVVEDFDFSKLKQDEWESYLQVFQDIPDYACLVFTYLSVDFKIDKKKENAPLQDYFNKTACVVKFEAQSKDNLEKWIRKHFESHGKTIGTAAVERLLFLCGSYMTGLLPEIEKIAAYTKGQEVRIEDIEAVADPVLEAKVFEITNAITAGNYDSACSILGQLIKQQEEPIMINAIIGKELRKIYSARLALDSGKGIDWLMQLWDMKSDYPAKLLFQAAKRVDHDWCRNAVHMSEQVDVHLKGNRTSSEEDELKTLLVRLAQGGKA